MSLSVWKYELKRQDDDQQIDIAERFGKTRKTVIKLVSNYRIRERG